MVVVLMLKLQHKDRTMLDVLLSVVVTDLVHIQILAILKLNNVNVDRALVGRNAIVANRVSGVFQKSVQDIVVVYVRITKNDIIPPNIKFCSMRLFCFWFGKR